LAPDEIAPGVHVLWGKQEAMLPTNGAHIANMGFIVGDDAILVIDAGPTRRFGEQLIDAIRAISDQPITAVAVTHQHQDHSLGLSVFVDRDIPVIMHANDAPLMARDAPTLLGFMTDIIGEEWTDGTTVAAPSQLITESLTLDLGARLVDIFVFENGHTPGDIAILDRTSGTLFSGDLVFNGRAPTVPHANIQTWLGQLTALADLQWDRLIPGHGPLVTDRDVFEGMATYLTFLENHTACSYRMGDSQAEALLIDLPPDAANLANIDREFQRSVFQLFRKYDKGDVPPC
jgi:uncharacterized sulfatase